MSEKQKETTANDTIIATTPLSELALLFLKLGTTAFGGPAAHIAMMEDEVVRRRRWLTQEEFLDMLGITNLLPGPNSTEMAIHIGWRRAHWAGLIVAGVSFILPAFLIVLALASAYVSYGTRPMPASILYGVKPVMIAIVFQALSRLGHAALKTRALALLTIPCVAMKLCGFDEISILLATGFIAASYPLGFRHRRSMNTRSALLPLTIVTGSVASAASFGLWTLFLYFFKIGSVLFGSGYVLLAFLRTDLVERMHWMTEAQLIDAVAIGQITPGPVFTTATFIGYLLQGPGGAIVATLGIFLPAFIFVAISGPLLPVLRSSQTAAAFLDAVNVASFVLLCVVTFQLGRASIVDPLTAALAIVSAVLLVRFQIRSTWLIAAGACAGMLTALAQ